MMMFVCRPMNWLWCRIVYETNYVCGVGVRVTFFQSRPAQFWFGLMLGLVILGTHSFSVLLHEQHYPMLTVQHRNHSLLYIVFDRVRRNHVAWHATSHYLAVQDLSGVMKPRRTRFSDDKSHACDVPGCRNTFYERGNMRRHQRMKHGRMKRSYDDHMRGIMGVQRLPSHTSVSVQQSNTIRPPQGDAV